MRYLFILFFNCAPLIALAQLVSSVQAQQEGQDVVVSYTLETESLVEINLFVSTDQGRSWQGPLLHCTGDVGKNVSAGSGKRIRWAVVQERELVGDGIRFKVVAKPAIMKPWLNPKLSYESVTDIDGNVYATIQIGTQLWMAENLRTSRYQNGDRIPNVTPSDIWSTLNKGAWAYYANTSQYDVPYGKLYNWYTVADSRNACPIDWHVPSDAEWKVLTDYLGSEFEGSAKTKSTGSQYWHNLEAEDTNSSGFSALPGGSRTDFGSFFELGKVGYWWSSTGYLKGNMGGTMSDILKKTPIEAGWGLQLKDRSLSTIFSNTKRFGASVRCLKD
jgi:uncharacterized protein (TIGR02145 family)